MKGLIRIYILMVSLTAFLLTQGCDRSRDDMTQPDSDCITLTVDVPFAGTRAGSDELNEFTVKSLHLFFYTAEGHDDDTSEAIYDVTIDGEFVYSRHITLALPDNALKDGGLFGPASDRCYVYAVANVDENRLTSATVSGLKSTVVDSDFDKTRVQDSFAMDGFAELSLNRADRIVSGTVTLQRAAAKLTLSVDLPQMIEVEQKIISPVDGSEQIIRITYHSRAEDMHVWIANGVAQSRLNTPALPADEDALYSNEIYAAENVGSAFTRDDSQPKYKYVQNVPFYSYPNRWDSFSPRGNCFLTLEIPWWYTDEQGKVQNIVTYYRLSVQPERYYIERNTHYDMRVTIGRLGGVSEQQPVDMLFDWNYNMEWNVHTLPTDIKEIRYLLLNNNDFSTQLDAYSYMMENETSISIPYNTSHPVEIESVQMVWHDFKNDRDRNITLAKTGTYTYSDCSAYQRTTHFAGIEVDPVKGTLNIRRDLLHISWDNRATLTTEDAINAYTFTIRLRHTDAPANEPSARATVAVTQIPAIYITSQLTESGTRFINNQNRTYEFRSGSWWSGYVYNYKGYLTQDDDWPSNAQKKRYWLGSYHNENSGFINNKNTYVLTISKFATNDNYIIADPRKRDIDNLNESDLSASDAADWSMEVNNRQMQYYYPADDDASKTRFIAPQIRVASQWGVTYQISRRGAQRRCASYQENGRPAGRWRLPTAAEIEYICRLSNKQYIPYLFGTQGGTANYWCASGGVDVNNSTTNPSVTVVPTEDGDNERRAVRCVYDEWYWKGDTLTTKTRFAWGDRRRTTNGNRP